MLEIITTAITIITFIYFVNDKFKKCKIRYAVVKKGGPHGLPAHIKRAG